jgi:protein gp37
MRIEWTDATWNPVRGCTKVSPGCKNCYAETFAERWRGVPGHAYEQGFDLRLVPEKLDEPLRWKKPRRIFVNSMSDLFQEGVPDDLHRDVFAVMALAPQHTFQVLTKRADRMRDYCRSAIRVRPAGDRASVAWPLPNVWLGVSVENQHFADERIPLLLQTPAAVRFISAEPLLGSTGQRFWGCNAYPKCRGTRDTDGEAPQRTTRADQVDDESDLPSERARRHDDGRWRQR